MDEALLRGILEAEPHKFGKVLANAEKHRLQIILSEVGRDPATGRPALIRHGLRVDAEYFYPASAVKICAAVAALQKLAALRSAPRRIACSPESPLVVHPCHPGEAELRKDPSNRAGGAVTVAHLIRKVFLVSDNPAFNHLFSFVGHRALNESMWAAGLGRTMLYHRLSASSAYSGAAANRPSPLVDVYDAAGNAHSLPGEVSDLALQSNTGLPGSTVGTGWVDGGGTLVESPMDFSEKNRMPLAEMQDLLVALLRPDLLPEGAARPELDESDRLFLAEAMAQCPTESSNPEYDRKTYFEDWNKFFGPGLGKVSSRRRWRVFNKMGQAYGFTVDNAYVVDLEGGRSFFLTAAIYTNENGVLNDDQYEYSVAEPFLADLAEAVARHLTGDPQGAPPAAGVKGAASGRWAAGGAAGGGAGGEAGGGLRAAVHGRGTGALAVAAAGAAVALVMLLRATRR